MNQTQIESFIDCIL